MKFCQNPPSLKGFAAEDVCLKPFVFQFDRLKEKESRAMPLSRDTLEYQIKLAKDALAKWVAVLGEKGTERAAFRRNPKWRQLNAECNKIKRRLNRVAEIEANNEEVAQRKAAKLAAADSAA